MLRWFNETCHYRVERKQGFPQLCVRCFCVRTRNYIYFPHSEEDNKVWEDTSGLVWQSVFKVSICFRMTDSLPHLPLHQDSAIAPMCCWALRVCVYTVCVCVTSTTSTPVTIANIPCRSCFPLLKGWYRQRQRTHRSFLRLNAKSSSACWKGKKNR